MAKGSQNSSRWIALAACLLAAVVLSACQQPDETPPLSSPASGSSTPSGAPSASSRTASDSASESPEQIDLRRAGEAVVNYWALVDQLAANPESSIDELRTVASDQAFAQRRVALNTYRTKGWIQTGTATLTDVRATGVKAATFSVSACVDVSDIDFVDGSGKSQVNPNRPDAQQFSYTVDKRTDRFLVVRDTLEGEPC